MPKDHQQDRLIRMHAFAAKLRFSFWNLSDEGQGADVTVEERVMLISSATSKNALRLATERGRESAFEATSTRTGLKFLGIVSLWRIAIESEPDEPWYEILEVSAAELAQMVPGSVIGDLDVEREDGYERLEAWVAEHRDSRLRKLEVTDTGLALHFDGNYVVSILTRPDPFVVSQAVATLGSPLDNLRLGEGRLEFEFPTGALVVEAEPLDSGAKWETPPCPLPTGAWWLLRGPARWSELT